MKRAGVILHAERDQAVTTARALIETLLSRGVDVWALDGDADRIGLPGINATPAMPENLDLVIVFGGDGTLLRAAEAVGRSGVPLLGINFGHLGFLSELERSELDDGLKRLLDNGFIVEERLVLEAEVDHGDRVETLRALEEALLEFAGSVLVISHDRWFLDRIATHILAAEDNSQWSFFVGNYQEYETDKRRRLGEEGARPHRPRYKPLHS